MATAEPTDSFWNAASVNMKEITRKLESAPKWDHECFALLKCQCVTITTFQFEEIQKPINEKFHEKQRF